ncbi:uncharacterized protein LOC113381821 [Ctenocephalides felis]|uniref:uncharacterized protein LOC113381821 n=1 Tax=Ctenocephalides felis TaxID=7515 RepID=UPI000E6E219A|nr:uncharacterized protein LOC113381821 [Ctenocephalides felis]
MSMNANREIDAEKVRKDFEFESLAPSRMEDGSDNAFSERVLPEALKSKCQRCSLKQKESALKVIRRLHDAYPDKWLELAERYDPTGDYRKSYEEYLRNEQYNIIDGAEPAINSVQGNVLPEIGTRFNFEETKPIEKPDIQEFNKPSNNVNNEHKSAPPVRSVSNGASGPNANTLPPATEKAPPAPPAPPAPSTTYTPIIVQSNPSTTRSTIFTIQGNFQARPLSSQVLGIVSNLGNKVARTAGIITGMLKDTVHVIVG